MRGPETLQTVLCSDICLLKPARCFLCMKKFATTSRLRHAQGRALLQRFSSTMPNLVEFDQLTSGFFLQWWLEDIFRSDRAFTGECLLRLSVLFTCFKKRCSRIGDAEDYIWRRSSLGAYQAWLAVSGVDWTWRSRIVTESWRKRKFVCAITFKRGCCQKSERAVRLLHGWKQFIGGSSSATVLGFVFCWVGALNSESRSTSQCNCIAF